LPKEFDLETIRELLSKIRWDEDFGRAAFELGYWDRVEERVVRAPFASLEFAPESSSFTFFDAEGRRRSVPLHRVRCVWRNNEIIWSRKCRP
jgi:uncharacterized protein (UPF0248 family)